ncbi:hypothetical protein ZWY2020_037503 [Hordeum vulgare]|nr:hypothetical protein ZWY2020_037503 [Hordeum vulgare]
MSFRRALVVLATVLILVLLLLLLVPAIAHADSIAAAAAAGGGGRRTSSNVVRRNLRRKKIMPTQPIKLDLRSYRRAPAAGHHRKLLEPSPGPSPGPSPEPSQSESAIEVDVASYGAVGDGQQDDTRAFQKAWADVCSSSQPATLVVPREKTYLVKQTTFLGNCKSPVTFRLDGKMVAPASRSAWPKENMRWWIMFRDVDRLTVTGDGTIDGNGEMWWKTSCRVDKKLKCTDAPMALLLSKCNNLTVENIQLLNSQQIHMSVEDCQDVLLKGITITAPGDSPNNDGIHIARTKDIQVLDCDIKTGDDCVSIETGTENLYASRITCGPGHGISIGSLGDDNSEAQVSNITVYKAHLSGTTNGVRMKSWQGGKGYAKDITFEDITMEDVHNPIIIDQNYCTSADPANPKPCKKQTSAVEFSNIQFKNIRGTSATEEAIKLDCSDTVPCHDILLQDVELTFRGHKHKHKHANATSVCNNVKLTESGSNVVPKTC